MSSRIGFATCAPWPEIARGDRPVAEALTERGHQVVPVPWNGTGDSSPPPLASLDLLVHRSDWDHHHAPAAFRAWCAEVLAAGLPMVNSWPLIDWGLDKRYLFDVIRADLPAPATIEVESADQLASWISDHGFERAVLKPTSGASGHGVELIDAHDLSGGLSRAAESTPGRTLLAQEFLADITDGEVSTVFIAGVASHAFRKVPAAGEFRVNGGHGGKSHAEPLTPSLVDLGSRVLAALPDEPVYVRVDTVTTSRGPLVLEVEVVEPGLGFDLVPEAAPGFADAILAAAP